MSMIAFAGAIEAYPLSVAAVAPCTHVEQSNSPSAVKRTMVKELVIQYLLSFNVDMAKGVSTTGLEVSHSFHQREWIVYTVSAPAVGLERAFLFVNRNMPSTQRPYVWGGSATLDERSNILAEIKNNNMCIGSDLAACVVDTILGRVR